MDNFEIIKQLYEWGCDIESYLKLGAITEEEYQEITGKDGING